MQKILDAGATITGKTICDEFFDSVSGTNVHYGTPVNARAPGRLPGGSSAGSAAACGAGLCDFALGSDTGGSVRVPASFNGNSTASGRRTSASSTKESPTWRRPSTCRAGSRRPQVFSAKIGPVLLDSHRMTAKIERVVVLEDAFAQAEKPVADVLRTVSNS